MATGLPTSRCEALSGYYKTVSNPKMIEKTIVLGDNGLPIMSRWNRPLVGITDLSRTTIGQNTVQYLRQVRKRIKIEVGIIGYNYKAAQPRE